MTSPSTIPSPGDDASSPAPASSAGQTAPASPAQLAEDTVVALQRALVSEHAAIWAYGLIAAFDKDNAATITSMRDSHLMRRNDASAMLTAAGVKPKATAAAYTFPVEVKDANTARQLALAAEADNATGWLGVVTATDDAQLRSFALAGLTAAAVRMTTWKQILKRNPPTTTFPGRPTPK